MPAFNVPANFAFDDYTGLVSAINDWLDREDLDGVAQQLIALAEARIRREIMPLYLETAGSVACVEGIGALPADCGELLRVSYNGCTLPQVAITAGLCYPASSTPSAYTLEAGGLHIWPETTQTVAITYRAKLPSLSEGTPNNPLLDDFPDLYFFGALLFAEGYLANDERAATFKVLWEEALEGVKRHLVRQKFAGPLIPKVAFVP